MRYVPVFRRVYDVLYAVSNQFFEELNLLESQEGIRTKCSRS